jgi:hypothetical protein
MVIDTQNNYHNLLAHAHQGVKNETQAVAYSLEIRLPIVKPEWLHIILNTILY